MSTYPNMNNNPELLKMRTKNDEIKDLKYKTEKHDHEKGLKCPKIGSEYYKKKYKSLNKKKVLIIITEYFVGCASTISRSTMDLINPGAGFIFSNSTALLTSIAILLTNEYISKFKKRHTKLRGWNNVITLLYEKTLKTSLVDKKNDKLINEKEVVELKKSYNHYLDKREEIMKSTQSKVEDVFGDVLSKDKFSQEQITKFNNFLAKIM